jgi:hypothetical protein
VLRGRAWSKFVRLLVVIINWPFTVVGNWVGRVIDGILALMVWKYG